MADSSLRSGQFVTIRFKLQGMQSIQKQHAVLYNNKGQVEIEPLDPGSKIKVNGLPLDNKKSLKHKDRILFGSNHLYVFINPVKKDASADLPKDISWEFAQKEIAQAKGFATGSGDGLSKDQQIAQEQILELLPMVSEANAVSEELDKHKSFEVVLISAAAQEGGHGSEKGTKVMVKMKNLLNGNTWLWERGKFMNRRYLIQEMYQKYLDGDDSFQVPQDQDPFWEPSEDVLIGTANVFLDSLSYALDFDDSLSVTDYKGLEEGSLDINITPCKKAGRPLDESDYVEDPSELLGKPYHFKVTVKSAEVNKIRFSKGTMVKYKVYTDREYTKTKMVSDTLAPDFNHSAVFGFPSVNQELLEFFSSGCITFLLYGMQVDIMPDSKMLKLTTRELRQMENMNGVGLQRRKSLAFSKDDSSDHSHLKTEMVLLQRKHDRLVQKEARIQQPYDIVSIYVFGEEEAELVADAQNNNGIVSMEKLTQYSYCNSTPLSREKTQLWDHESMSSVDLNPYLRPDTAYDDDYAYQEVHAKPVKVYAKNYDRHSSLDSRGPSRRRSRRNRNRHKQGGNNQKQNGNRSNSSRGLVKSDSGEQRDGSATCVLQ